MHILIIPSWHDVDYTDENHNFIHDFATFLCEIDELEVGMIFFEGLFTQMKDKYISNSEVSYHYKGLKGFSFPKRNVFWRLYLRKYLKLFDKYVSEYGKPDLVHAHSIIALIVANYIYENRRIEFVYTEHIGQLEQNNYLRKELFNCAKSSMNNAVVSTSVSPEMCRILNKKFHVHFEYVPNMLNTSRYFPKKRHSKEKKFIFIGEPVEIKGIDILIKAWKIVLKRFPEARLIILDEIRDLYKIKPLLNSDTVKDSIIFKGVVSPNRVAEELRNADVLISSSRYESFGMVLIESAACGTPIVATKTPGAKLIVNSNIGKLVNKNDFQKLASAAIELYQALDSFVPEIMNAYIRENFDKSIVARQWYHIYQGIKKANHVDL